MIWSYKWAMILTAVQSLTERDEGEQVVQFLFAWYHSLSVSTQKFKDPTWMISTIKKKEGRKAKFFNIWQKETNKNKVKMDK